MGNFLRLVNGRPVSFAESGALPAIYDQSVSIVTSGGNGSTTLNGPITSGTAITLPSSGSYTVSGGVYNLQVYLNGDRTENSFDWSTSGSGPNYTAISFTFDLVVGDRVDFRIERNS